LRAGHQDYLLNTDALEYMRANKLPEAQLESLAGDDQRFANREEWRAALAARDITKERHIRIATEGALLVSRGLLKSSEARHAGGGRGLPSEHFSKPLLITEAPYGEAVTT
jgi:hypothetical protein